MDRKRAFPPVVDKETKRVAGRTAPGRTPLNLRLSGVSLPDDVNDYIRERAARKLGKFAYHIERVTVRLRDVNGPRGGVDIECSIKVVLTGAPSIVVTDQDETARKAFDVVMSSTERTVRRQIERRGWSAGRGTAAKEAKGARRGDREVSEPAIPPPADGSLIGRRVGRAQANLEQAAERPEKERGDIPVDTSEPGRSASDRRAGGGSTAARNTKLDDSGMVATLEDSARDRPSRKSTRRSAGRLKRDDPKRLTTNRETQSPKARATKSAAKKS